MAEAECKLETVESNEEQLGLLLSVFEVSHIGDEVDFFKPKIEIGVYDLVAYSPDDQTNKLLQDSK